jgi:hypothetical protein
MQRSKAYYVTRGIARLVVLLIQATLVIGAMYAFILWAWAMS